MKNSLIFTMAALALSLSSLTYAADAKKNAELVVLSASSEALITKVEKEFNRIAATTNTFDYQEADAREKAGYAVRTTIKVGSSAKEIQIQTLKLVDLIYQKIDKLGTRVGALETQVAALGKP